MENESSFWWVCEFYIVHNIQIARRFYNLAFIGERIYRQEKRLKAVLSTIGEPALQIETIRKCI